MVSVAFSTLVSRRLFEYSIYTIKLAARGIVLRGGKDQAILQSVKVYEVMDRNFETLDPSSHLREILRKIENSRESYFLVVDRSQHLHGVISFQDLRGILTRTDLADLVIAEDIEHTHPLTVYPDDSLAEARKKFALQDLQLLPVVDSHDEKRILGVLRYGDMMNIYNKRLIESLQQ
jgi:CIC family chloride channel protein